MSSVANHTQDNLSQISISVVINTCDRAESLEKLLYALNSQTYRNFEVIVVIGPTQDHTLKVLEPFAGRLRLVHCPLFNLSLSRNMGIAAAAGEVVAFIDDDALPCSTWLAQLAAAFSEPAVASTGGKVYQVYPQTGQIQFLYGVFSALGDDIDVRSQPDEPLPAHPARTFWFPRLMGTNMAFRRQALIDVNGFDERFAYLFEEPDIAIRLSLRGYPTHHLSEAVVYHAPRSGRNREIFTWRINWYAWMRGIIYFTFKNGIPVAGFRLAFVRAFQHVLTFFQHVKEYRKDGSLPSKYYSEVLGQLLKGVAWGFWHGLFRRRKLAQNLAYTKPTQFQPFPVDHSTWQHPVSPFDNINQRTIKPMSQSPLRVCLLSLNYPPEKTDGVARSTHFLAQGLAELGHEVHVVKAGIADRVTYYDGAYVHEVRTKGHRYTKYQQQGYSLTCSWLNGSHAIHRCVQSLIINHHIQIVDSPLYQLEGLVTAVAGSVPVIIRLVTGVKQIIKLTEQVNPDTALIGELEARFMHLGSGIVANSRATQQAVATAYNLDFEQMPGENTVIYYGLKPVPESNLVPLDPASKDDPIILYVGRLERRKGVLDLFAAIPQVLDKFPRAQFWLAGQDNSGKDGFKAQNNLDYPGYFRRHYSKYVDNVHFLGFVPDDKLPQLYQHCDLFVAPSLYESFGLIYLEAMNYARPVIGCAVGGPTEIIEDEVTGFLVEPEQPRRLAEKINQLLTNRTQLREFGLAGRQRLVDHFSYLEMARNFAEFYRQIIEQQKKGG